MNFALTAIDSAIGTHPAYSAAKLDLGLYAGQSGAVQSFGPRAVLVTTAKLDDATVERLMTGLLKHVDDLKKAHPDRDIAVIIPELIGTRWYHYVLHNQTAAVMVAYLRLSGFRKVVVINVPWYLSE